MAFQLKRCPVSDFHQLLANYRDGVCCRHSIRRRSSRKREGLCGTRTCSYLIFFKRVVVKNKSRVRACQLALYTRHARSVPNLGEQKPQPHEKPSLALRPAGTTSRQMNTDSEARLLPGERRLRLW